MGPNAPIETGLKVGVPFGTIVLVPGMGASIYVMKIWGLVGSAGKLGSGAQVLPNWFP